MAKIKKARVQEVSLAAFPKNGKRFCIVKDNNEGGNTMDPITRLMAFLAAKSTNVSEVVKEEIKSVQKDISTADILEIFKDMFAGYIVELKKDGVKVVDTTKMDVVEKDSWIPKPAAEPAIPEAIKKEMDGYKAKIAEIELREFTKDVESMVGKDLVGEFVALHGKLNKDEIGKVLGIVKFQQDIINELGKSQMSKDTNHRVNAAAIEKEVEALAKDQGISMIQAWEAYAKANPTKIAALDN